MRLSLVICFAVLLVSCNSSDKEKKEQSTSTGEDSSANNAATEQQQPEGINRILPAILATADIPPTLKFKGKVKQAWQWTDKLGDNILITSAIAPYDDKDEYGGEGQTAEVYAFHYVKKEGDYNLLWKISDTVKACALDMDCDFISGTTSVTDLDKNGIAETKVQYVTSCHGDVSPAFMNLIMHEGTVKYALTGSRWIGETPESKFDITEDDVDLEKLPGYNKEKDAGSQKTLGRYETEKEFAGAPAAFLVYARSEWLKFAKEQDQ